MHVATNEAALQQAVATIGPISVGVNANSNWNFYKSGEEHLYSNGHEFAQAYSMINFA
jgi:hypothetical protein